MGELGSGLTLWDLVALGKEFVFLFSKYQGKTLDYF